MKKISLFLCISLITLSFTQAQNEMDALRYSMIDPGGTARFSGMAGAFGALGGDFSALSINPAGIGIFRSSEITITPSMNFQSVESQLFGSSEIDDKYSFNLNNLGLVFSIPVGNASEGGGLKFVNFGVGVNRHNNFNNRWLAEGFNNNNSLMTSLLEQANVQGSPENLDDFSTGLAWDTYLLDMEDGTYFVDMYDGQVLQTQIMNSSGYVRELVFSLGTNYNDILYFGASVGLPSVRYKQSGTLMEKDNNNVNDYFNTLTYTEAYETKGTGFNVKFGGIARLGSIRLGAALHTPTFYSLEDVYNTTMRSDLNLDPESYPGYTESAKFAESPTGNFKYELNTPLKAIGSLGLVFGTMGLISIDYEYTDYTNARLRSDDFVFTEANKMIKSNLNAQHNIRVGGEIQVKPVILRAGYGYYSSPYKEGINDAQRSVIAAGFGFRDRHYFIDFSYSYSFFSEDYILYQVENINMSPIVSRDFSANTFKLTFGWRF
jgi:hypothetical protein